MPLPSASKPRRLCLDKPAAREYISRIMKKFHDVKNYTTRVIRIPPAVHRELKILAASEGMALGELAAEALARELSRRQVKAPDGSSSS